MRRAIQFVSKDPLVFYPLFISVALVLAQIVFLVFGLRPAKESIFLHYTTYLGVDYVGAPTVAYFIPLASILWTILNGVLARSIERKDMLLAYFLNISAAIGACLLFILVVLLVRINR